MIVLRSKMVPLEDIQGRFYRFKSRSMLRFEHAYSRCYRRRTQPPASRPRCCAKKVGLCKIHDSDYLKFKQFSHRLRSTPPVYLDVKRSRRLCAYPPNTEEGLCNPTSSSKPPRMVSRRYYPIFYYITKVFIPKD